MDNLRSMHLDGCGEIRCEGFVLLVQAIVSGSRKYTNGAEMDDVYVLLFHGKWGVFIFLFLKLFRVN